MQSLTSVWRTSSTLPGLPEPSFCVMPGQMSLDVGCVCSTDSNGDSSSHAGCNAIPTINVVVSRIAALGMSAAARQPAEAFTLLARASSFVSLTHGHDWTTDIAAQVAFHTIGAMHEWSHDNGPQSSSESVVSVRNWECALIELTENCPDQVRIAKVRLVDVMKPDRPDKSWHLRLDAVVAPLVNLSRAMWSQSQRGKRLIQLIQLEGKRLIQPAWGSTAKGLLQ